MLQKLLLLICCIALLPSVKAQDDGLEFNKKYYECENKWVLLPKQATDTTYSYGFIYLDRAAGFTYHHGGSLQILKTGNYVAKPFTNSSIKHRLEPNTVLMAILPADKIKEIGLPQEPEWLAIYREGENETASQVIRGYHFNHVGGSTQALPILLKAYEKEPHARGLEFELGYAYNATGEFDKAAKILEDALKHDASNSLFYQELGYSYIHLGKLAEADKIYTKGIELSTNKLYQAEMAFNMAGAYSKIKQKKKFNSWAAIVKKYAEKDSFYYQNLLKLESEIKE